MQEIEAGGSWERSDKDDYFYYHKDIKWYVVTLHLNMPNIRPKVPNIYGVNLECLVKNKTLQ